MWRNQHDSQPISLFSPYGTPKSLHARVDPDPIEMFRVPAFTHRRYQKWVRRFPLWVSVDLCSSGIKRHSYIKDEAADLTGRKGIASRLIDIARPHRLMRTKR